MNIVAGRPECVRTKRQAAWPLAVRSRGPGLTDGLSIAPKEGRAVFQARFHPHAITKSHEIRLGSARVKHLRCRGALRCRTIPPRVILVGYRPRADNRSGDQIPRIGRRVRSAGARADPHCIAIGGDRSACRSSRTQERTAGATWQSRHASLSSSGRDGNRRHRAMWLALQPAENRSSSRIGRDAAQAPVVDLHDQTENMGTRHSGRAAPMGTTSVDDSETPPSENRCHPRPRADARSSVRCEESGRRTP